MPRLTRLADIVASVEIRDFCAAVSKTFLTEGVEIKLSAEFRSPRMSEMNESLRQALDEHREAQPQSQSPPQPPEISVRRRKSPTQAQTRGGHDLRMLGPRLSKP